MKMNQNKPYSQKQMANYESVKLLTGNGVTVDLYTYLPYHSEHGSIFKL